MERIIPDTKTSQNSFGVNIGGYISSESGLGEAVRSNIRSIDTTGIPYRLNCFADDQGAKNTDKTYTHYSRENPYSINLVHVNAFERSRLMEKLDKRYLKDRHNIGFWAWEFSKFPPEWLSSFQYFDEIWVPSSYNQEAISPVSPIPVIVIPHSLPEDMSLLNLSRSQLGLPEDHFVFLFVFNFSGHFNRKNPLGLIRAFKKAFNRKEKACLVLKCLNSELFSDKFAKMKEASRGGKIIIIDKVFNKSKVNTLMSLCDCYVSLHRSEGFGLTMAEAMQLKKPVIATGYSGNTDFMKYDNSFLVDHDLVNIERSDITARNWSPLPFQKGYVWAKPDINHAAKLMRYVYENKKQAAKTGEKASREVKQSLSPNVVGEKIATRLKEIAKIR